VVIGNMPGITGCGARLPETDPRHAWKISVLSVLTFMTVSAQGDEVHIVVIALLAPQLLVVDM
jgi:hypothetical protein